MTKDDFLSFSALWIATGELYGKAPSDAALNLAFQALRRYSLADTKRALGAHVQDAADGRFMPKPADLVKHIDGDPESRALLAWTLVETAIAKHGPYATVIFDDRSIMTTIEDMGGWLDLCAVTDTDLPFRRNEFARRYRGYLNRPPSLHPAKLLGISDSHNSRLDVPRLMDPVLVGDPQKCLEVHQSGGEKPKGPATLGQLMRQAGIEQAAIEHDAGDS